MRFPFPYFPAEFEIPDDWWHEAGMKGFTPSSSAYRSSANATVTALRHIEPPFRWPECPLDWGGFNRARFVSILSGIVRDEEIEPVPVLELHYPDFPPAPFRFRICNGVHRFYASLVAGFGCLPVLIQ